MLTRQGLHSISLQLLLAKRCRRLVNCALPAAANPEDIELDEPAEDDEEADAEADAVVQQVCASAALRLSRHESVLSRWPSFLWLGATMCNM
jgi:hypothetical protein